MGGRVAVVVPCYNQGPWLPEALASVRRQTFQDLEVVVVDDGSDDVDTVAVLARVERDGVKVLRIERRGLPGARNAGIRASAAELICCLDADDILEPAWIATAAEVLDRNPDTHFVSHWLVAFGDESWTWRPQRCDLATLLDMNTVNGAAVVRRRALDAVGLFDESLTRGCEDWDLWIRMTERGFRGRIVPEVMFRYRRHAGSMSRRMPHLDLLRGLVRRHEGSYRAHLLELMLRRELGIADRLRERFDLARSHARWAEPELARRREEGDRLAAMVVARRAPEDAPAAELAELVRQIDEVRRSWSWRITAPLRRGLGLLRGEERTAPPAPPSAAEARAVLEALRASRSWRLTAPLRRAGTWVRGRP
jgi:glycosyltransferase involved in cell wall biosynthesis